jgi:two-component sensor histidine kinase
MEHAPGQTDSHDRRVLILAPTEGDATVARAVMERAGLPCAVVGDITRLCQLVRAGAGAILVTDEFQHESSAEYLAREIAAQPAWSDIPVVVLAAEGADSPIAIWMMERMTNVTVLERPARVSTLVSMVRTAIKARQRQYELRDSVEALRQSEEQYRKIAENQKFLAAELSHRVKNTLATVKAIVSQTRLYSGTLEEFDRAIEGRLRMLGQAHSILSAGEWQGAPLDDVFRGVLAPYPQLASGSIRLRGPAVMLPAQRVLALSMLIHELATNALKHGALRARSGTIDVNWTVQDGRVAIRWNEDGGPPVTPPARYGFGTSLIERLVSFELFGESKMSWDGDGLCCDIEFPISAAETEVQQAASKAANA